MKSTTIRNIPDDLWRRVKSTAALEGVSINQKIIDLLQKWVENKNDPQ